MKTNIQLVLDSLNEFGPMSISQISNHIDLTHRQISSTLSWLETKQLIFFYGTRKNDRKHEENIYTTEEELKTFQSENKPKEHAKIESITTKPWSANELHYGRDGKRFNWSDIEKEAKAVMYHPENKAMNRLPFTVIDGDNLRRKAYLEALVQKDLSKNSVLADVIKSVCANCGKPIEQHSKATQLCPDRFAHFEQTVL